MVVSCEREGLHDCWFFSFLLKQYILVTSFRKGGLVWPWDKSSEAVLYFCLVWKNIELASDKVKGRRGCYSYFFTRL